MIVSGINRILNWCQVIDGGRRYTCPTKEEGGKLFFHFKKKWHSVDKHSSNRTEELYYSKDGKVRSRLFRS